MEQENLNQEMDWRSSVTEPKDTLKIADKESVVFTFVDEGERRTHSEYGTSVVFKVTLQDNSEKVWYVNAMNYDLLGQIKSLGETITGLKVKVSRFGSKRSDTRYSIENTEQ